MRRLDFATCNTAPTDKLQKLRDGGGLYLHIKPNGRRGWRFYYTRPASKKQNTISFGSFPEVPLGDARVKCDAARALLAKGIDPSTDNGETKRAAVAQTAGAVTFLAFTNFEKPSEAGEIIEGAFWKFYANAKRQDGAPKCHTTLRCEKIRLRTLQKSLGHRPVAEIDSGEIQAILDELSDDGTLDKAHRVQQLAARIFDLAVARRLCKHNVAASCKNALVKHFKKKRPALTDQIIKVGLEETEARVGELMRRLRGFKGRKRTALALEMMALTFPRPHNITGMRWDDIKGDMWTIPEDKMKMRRIHKVPLSRQALAILDYMRPLTGAGKRIFPMNKDCLTRALAKMGYDTDNEQSTHGCRSIASTLLNESGEFSSDAIELQLAHEVGSERPAGDRRGGTVRATYNRAERMDERKEMMQFWADYLDRLRDGNVVTLTKAA
jgi:integrase